MEAPQISPFESSQVLDYELEKEINEFEKTKAGVKGLADSGITKIPRIFHNPPKGSSPISNRDLTQLQAPVIDVSLCDTPRIVEQVREAAENWGLFQIVNHGIPLHVMEEILQVTRRFHEQPTQVKRSLYTSDSTRRVRLFSNALLRAKKHGDWRDSLICDYYDSKLDPQQLPLLCREAITNYEKEMMKVKDMISQLLSAALGLDSNYLSRIECMNSMKLGCHYYPPCPEPELTMGSTNHSDPFFLTLLSQCSIGGLQVLHQNYWVDVQPISGALIVNLGDLMQLITNDKFKSAEHRVLAGKKGPRVSVACFFYPSTKNKYKPYGPIEELQKLENNEAIYKQVSIADYMGYYTRKGLDGHSTLPCLKQ